MKSKASIVVGFASILSLLLITVTGCATANLQVVKDVPPPPPKKVMVKIEGGQEVEMPKEALDSFRSMVTTALSKNGFQFAPTNPDSSSVALMGTITVYDPGNRFMRWFLPGGLGMFGGYFDSIWIVTDSKGVELAKAKIDGSIHGGVFGGSIDEVLTEAAERVADFLAKKPPKEPQFKEGG